MLIRIKNLTLVLFREIESIFNLLSIKLKHKRNEKIRVVFITQYIPAWNKSEPVYQRMRANTKFEVSILCVPSEIKNNILSAEIKVNSTYEYFKTHGYENVIDAMLPAGNWFDLKSLSPDYVFYTRPYNTFMPSCYTAQIVSKYTKICLIMYAYNTSKDIIAIHGGIRDFYSYMYFYFAESDYAASYHKNKNALRIKFGLQKIMHSGYMVLETIYKRKNETTDIWNFSDNTFRVIWTPRWTSDPGSGSTNFFKYKDFFINFAKDNSKIDFLFRPHPLTFSHFIETGEMTAEDVQSFRDNCEHAKNIYLDETEEYIPTIWNSSVLISDNSSLLIEYFATGKPVIFCQSYMTMEFLDEVKKIIYEGCYVASNEDDIRKYISELQCGNDYLKQKRAEIISDIWGDDLENISKIVTENIVSDHFK